MGFVGVALLVTGIATIGLASSLLLRLRRDLRRLDDAMRAAAERVDALPPDLVRALGTGDRRVIAIELLNPFELAGRSTWFAKPLSVVTPDLLRGVVNQRAVTLFREKSEEYGVRADIRLHRAG